MKKMNLLFVAPTDSLTGGGEISHFELILDAKRRGHQVHVVVPSKGKLSQQLAKEGVSSISTPYYWWGTFSRPTQAAANLTSTATISWLAEKIETEVVITNSLNVPWGAMAAAMAGLPHVWLAREMPLFQYSYLEDYYGFIKNYSNLILANSKTNAEFISRKTGRIEGYLYPYVDTTNLKLNNDITKTRLVNVGNIQSGKNQLDLINAAGILRRKGLLNTEVLLFGYQRDKRYKEKVKKAIAKHKLSKFVKVYAFKSSPYEMIGPNDIFVQTSGYESFGRTTVEAMKLGLITVAADIPATREVLSHGGGTLYKLGNAKDLANKLEAILSDMQTYKAQAIDAKKSAISNLSESACHNPFFRLLKDVAGQKNPRAELEVLLSQFGSFSKSIREYEKKINEYKKTIEKRNREIDSIKNSKAYKSALNLRKLLGR